jgi:hypothetical protein
MQSWLPEFSFVLLCCKYDFKSFEYWMKMTVKKLHILAGNSMTHLIVLPKGNQLAKFYGGKIA